MARETAEYVMKHFAKEAAGETVESMATKLTVLGGKYGDEALVAVKSVGPRTFRLVEEAGEHGPAAIKLMLRHGDEAAWVISQPKRFAVFIQHGDDAADAMIKHKDIVLPLLERYGVVAGRGFKAVDGQNARRIAMMDDAGDLARMGRTNEVLEVVGTYGDKAADFIWRNKGALTVTATLGAFLADPEPFISGAKDIAKVAGDVAKEPLREVARGTNWTVVILSGLIVVVGLLAIRFRRFLLGPVRAAGRPQQ